MMTHTVFTYDFFGCIKIALIKNLIVIAHIIYKTYSERE